MPRLVRSDDSLRQIKAKKNRKATYNDLVRLLNKQTERLIMPTEEVEAKNDAKWLRDIVRKEKRSSTLLQSLSKAKNVLNEKTKNRVTPVKSRETSTSILANEIDPSVAMQSSKDVGTLIGPTSKQPSPEKKPEEDKASNEDLLEKLFQKYSTSEDSELKKAGTQIITDLEHDIKFKGSSNIEIGPLEYTLDEFEDAMRFISSGTDISKTDDKIRAFIATYSKLMYDKNKIKTSYFNYPPSFKGFHYVSKHDAEMMLGEQKGVERSDVLLVQIKANLKEIRKKLLPEDFTFNIDSIIKRIKEPNRKNAAEKVLELMINNEFKWNETGEISYKDGSVIEDSNIRDIIEFLYSEDFVDKSGVHMIPRGMGEFLEIRHESLENAPTDIVDELMRASYSFRKDDINIVDFYMRNKHVFENLYLDLEDWLSFPNYIPSNTFKDLLITFEHLDRRYTADLKDYVLSIFNKHPDASIEWGIDKPTRKKSLQLTKGDVVKNIEMFINALNQLVIFGSLG